MARDEALIAELLAGGRNWLQGSYDRLPAEAKAAHWLTDSPPRTQEWEEVYVGSGGHSPGIHGEAINLLSAAMGFDVRNPPDGDWRWTVLAQEGADAQIVSLANQWGCVSEGGTYDARTGRCTLPGQPPVEPPEPPVEPPEPPEPPAEPDPYVLKLQGGRFEARVRFENEVHSLDDALALSLQPVLHTDEAGIFWFYSLGNPEVFVKLLDGRRINNSGCWWVFAASLTDRLFELSIEDTKTGEVRHYIESDMPVRDTAAFPDGEA